MNKPRIAVWHWSKGEPVPDVAKGGVIIVEPGLHEGGMVSQIRASQARRSLCAGVWHVAIGARGGDTMHPGVIPALHVRTQSDLARLPELLAVKAERRALVCSPEEAIDFEPVLRRTEGEKREDGTTLCRRPGCTVWTACPNSAGYCGPCEFNMRRAIDVVFIVGFDKPMHPSWVKGIVEQCRAACVPVVLVTWGNWTPISESWPMDGRCEHAFIRSTSDKNELGISTYRTGPLYERATLDDEPVQDWPDWIGGDNVAV